MAKVKIGVQLCQQHTSYASYRGAWIRADAAGVDSIWNWDHFFPVWGPEDGAHFECWTTLAALGPATTQACIGPLVLCMEYRNPALVAQMAKTLDHSVGGRLILGVGAGWCETEFRAYGYRFAPIGERLRNLERGISIIKERWARDQPHPINRTIPILVGGGGETTTLRIVAQYADIWNFFGTPELWNRKNKILDEWCARVHRAPGQIERTAMITRKDLDKLDAYVSAGATHLICQLDPPFDMAPIEQLLAWRNA